MVAMDMAMDMVHGTMARGLLVLSLVLRLLLPARLILLLRPMSPARPLLRLRLILSLRPLLPPRLKLIPGMDTMDTGLMAMDTTMARGLLMPSLLLKPMLILGMDTTDTEDTEAIMAMPDLTIERGLLRLMLLLRLLLPARPLLRLRLILLLGLMLSLLLRPMLIPDMDTDTGMGHGERSKNTANRL